jgi:cob(I)alamin adenosyltransferase
MTSIQSPSARAFQTAISSATTKAEVTTALSTLEQAKDLTPSEKVGLAKAAFDHVSGKRLGFGVDTAFKGFIEGQGSPVGPKASPMMARIGAVLANSAQSLSDAMDTMMTTASRGKGGGVSSGGTPPQMHNLLKTVSNELSAVGGELSSVANDIAKGRGENISAGDVTMVWKQVAEAHSGIGDLLNTIKSSGSVTKAQLSSIVADMLRASSMANATKEVGQVQLAAVANQAVSTGKGGGVAQPSPFQPAPAPTNVNGSGLRPTTTVLNRVTDQQLQFAEGKLSAWHNTSAVSDNDVRVVRQTLGEIFQLPRGQYLTLEKASGDSAIFGGNLVKGEVRDAGGSVTSRFTGDLNTGNLQLEAVRVGK